MKKQTKTIKSKESKKYDERVKKLANKFKLTSEDLSNLTDLRYMIGEDAYETLELNKMDKWFMNFFNRIERITIPELYTHKNLKKKYPGKRKSVRIKW